MLTIELPWPSPTLSPNSRVHWRTKADATKKAKADAHWLARLEMRGSGIDITSFIGPIVVSMTFHPKQDRQRDLDNCQAMMKAALDGIAQALGVNDNMFRPVSMIGGNRDPSCVVVSLTPALQSIPVIGTIS